MSSSQMPSTERSHSAAKIVTVAAASALIAASAWGASSLLAAGGSAEGADKPNVVTVTAFDYAFQAPDTVPAGVTTFKVLNKGPDLHHIQLIRLDSGKTFQDLAKAMEGHHGPAPRWAVEVGGPNAPAPGGESSVTLSLKAGNYVLLCVIPAKDGVLHLMKGMVKTMTVVPSKSGAALPKADVVMTLKDYDFVMSKPLAAGKQVVRVRNEASQSHEVFIARLAPGKKAGASLASRSAAPRVWSRAPTTTWRWIWSPASTRSTASGPMRRTASRTSRTGW
jgi:hypothetical protein